MDTSKASNGHLMLSNQFTYNHEQVLSSEFQREDQESVEYIRKYGYLDQMISSASLIIYWMLNARNAEKAIIECGCGSGQVLPTLVQMKKQTCKLYMTDISRVRLGLVKEKCELLSKNPLSNSLFEHSKLPEKPFCCEDFYHNEKLNVVVQHADAMSLPFSNGTFDLYFGGLLVQEVTDPQSAIQEAFRVLRKGGRAGFTIYDAQEVDNKFDEILFKATDGNKSERTSGSDSEAQQMMDITQLKTYLEKAGFKDILIWTQFVPYNFFTKQNFADHLERGKPTELLTSEHRKIREEVLREFEVSIQAKDTPFGMNIICLVAQKPE